MKKKLIIAASALATVLLIGISPAVAAQYVVRAGDTLSALARTFNTTVSNLVEQNNIENPDLIYVGQELLVGEEEAFGAGYNPVTAYESRTTSYITAAATTIPVASTKDPSGNQISLSNISPSSTVNVYMNIEPGTVRQELIVCTGVTTISWTNCTRGLAFQGSSEAASSTLAFAHNAGSKIIITNIGQSFNQFVSTDGNVVINNIKTFTSFPKFSVTTTVPTQSNEFATKYYVDNVGAGGFTASNVSTTRGLSVDGSVPERVGINASSTGALGFDANGALYFSGTVINTTTFIGNVTSTGIFAVQTPTSSLDAVNKVYADNRVVMNSATGTAAVAITAGQTLYITSSSTLAIADSTRATSTFQFVGVAETSAAAGAEVRYTKPGGINRAQSNLQPGFSQYLNGLGAVTTTAGTFSARIGLALSAKEMQVLSPKYTYKGSGFFNCGNTASTFYSLGFYPSTVSISAGVTTTATTGIGSSVGNDLNVATRDNASGNAGYETALAWATAGSHSCDGTITKTANGFSLVKNSGNGTSYIIYSAESD